MSRGDILGREEKFRSLCLLFPLYFFLFLKSIFCDFGFRYPSFSSLVHTLFIWLPLSFLLVLSSILPVCCFLYRSFSLSRPISLSLDSTFVLSFYLVHSFYFCLPM